MANRKQKFIPTEDIVMSKILFIRNQKVMLDTDLAELYGVLPRRLREQVKRNLDRFPSNFMFQLTNNEIIKVSQFATPSKQKMGGSLPYAFTEHGVLMLANVLKSGRAVEVSLRLIEIFVKIRELLSSNKEVLFKLEQLEHTVSAHDADIKNIFAAVKQLLAPAKTATNRIGYRRKDELS